MDETTYEHILDSVNFISYSLLVLSIFVLIALLFITPAPYGRYHDLKNFQLFGGISGRFGWVLMESPNIIVPLITFITYRNILEIPIANLVLFGMYFLHYIYRSLIYPFLQNNKPHTSITVLCAFVFCSFNAYNQACSLGILYQYSANWFFQTNFIVGASLWAFGIFTNIYSDYLLKNLRKPGETGYKIPIGFMFDYVSCANYFGEVTEWFGFAIAVWNWAGLGFAVFTAANLVPRAIKHHQYYKEKFDNYPKERKAVIPFVL